MQMAIIFTLRVHNNIKNQATLSGRIFFASIHVFNAAMLGKRQSYKAGCLTIPTSHLTFDSYTAHVLQHIF